MDKKLTGTLVIVAASLGLLMPALSSAQHVDPNSVQNFDSRVPEEARLESTMKSGTAVDQMQGARSLKERIAADGAVLMSKAEVRDHLSGNTQQWSNGGAYFFDNGDLQFIWEGNEFGNYEWRIRGNGRVCITNPEGFTTSCSLYFKYKDTVWTVVTEEFGENRDFFGGPDTILPGNQLADLEPWDPALSGN